MDTTLLHLLLNSDLEGVLHILNTYSVSLSDLSTTENLSLIASGYALTAVLTIVGGLLALAAYRARQH